MSGSKKNYKGTPKERFLAKINYDGRLVDGMATNCWEWTGAKGQKQYPQLNVDGKPVKAVRFAWELSNNKKAPDGYRIGHYCSNSFCVRIDHLFISNTSGTKARPIVFGPHGEELKYCSNCNKLVPYTNEYYHKVENGRGLRSYCKECSYKKNREKRGKSWDYILWVNAKTSARKKAIEFSITRKDIIEINKKQNGICYWFNVPLVSCEKPRYPLQHSLDRLDLNKGYTKDNIVLCCYVANIGRNHNTVEEFNDFIEVLKKNINGKNKDSS